MRVNERGIPSPYRCRNTLYSFSEDELEWLIVDWIDNPKIGDPITVVEVGDLYQVDELFQNRNAELYFLTELERFSNGNFKRPYNGYSWHYTQANEGTLAQKVRYQVLRKKRIVDGLAVTIFTKKGGPKVTFFEYE